MGIVKTGANKAVAIIDHGNARRSLGKNALRLPDGGDAPFMHVKGKLAGVINAVLGGKDALRANYQVVLTGALHLHQHHLFLSMAMKPHVNTQCSVRAMRAHHYT